MGRDRLDRLWFSPSLFPPRWGGGGGIQHQHRRDVNAPKDDGTLVDTGKERIGGVWRGFFDQRVERVELHVGDDGKKAPPGLPMRDDVAAHSQPFDHRAPVELDV